MLVLLCSLSLCLNGAVAATTPAGKTPNPNDNLINDLADIGHYTKIMDLIGTYLPGMLTQLVAMPELSLFLPTDDAMSKVPADVIKDLQNDTQKLRDLILYHTSATQLRIRARNSNDKELMSVSGKPIRINVYKDPFNIHAAEGVKIVEENIHVANGFVQGIDGFMTPPKGDIVSLISQRPDMTTLTSLLTTANLTDLINRDRNMTIFAPTDAAFAKLSSNVTTYLGSHVNDLKDTLLFHVVKSRTWYSVGMRNGITVGTADSNHDKLMILEDYSGNIYLNRAKVTERDISATNGVIHVINDVLIPTEVLVDMAGKGLAVVG